MSHKRISRVTQKGIARMHAILKEIMSPINEENNEYCLCEQFS